MSHGACGTNRIPYWGIWDERECRVIAYLTATSVVSRVERTTTSHDVLFVPVSGMCKFSLKSDQTTNTAHGASKVGALCDHVVYVSIGIVYHGIMIP